MDIAYAISLLKSADESERIRGVMALSNYRVDKVAAQHLIDVLKGDPSFYVRLQAAKVLRMFKIQIDTASLYELLDSEKEIVEVVIDIIANHANKKIFKVYAERFSKDTSVSSTALANFVELAGRMGQWDVVMKFLDSRFWNVRDKAANVLASAVKEDTQVFKSLLEMVRRDGEKAWWSSVAIWKAFRNLDDDMLNELERFLKDEGELGRIGDRSVFLKWALFMNEKWKLDEFDKELTARYFGFVFRELLPQEIVAKFSFLLDDANRDVRYSVAFYLKDALKDPVYDTLLEKLFEKIGIEGKLALFCAFVNDGIFYDRWFEKIVELSEQKGNIDVLRKLFSESAKNFPEILVSYMEKLSLEGQDLLMVELAHRRYEPVKGILLKRFDEKITVEFFRALANFAQDLEVASKLLEVLKKLPLKFWERVYEAIVSLARSQPELILDTYNHCDWAKRALLKKIIKQVTSEITGTLIEALSSKNGIVTSMVMEVLSSSKEAILSLIGLFKSESWIMRRRAYEALKMADPYFTAEKLFFVVKSDPDENIMYWAERLLAYWSERIVDKLSEALNERNLHLNILVVRVIRHLNSLEIKELLSHALRDEFDEVRLEALRALKNHPFVEFLDLLKKSWGMESRAWKVEALKIMAFLGEVELYDEVAKSGDFEILSALLEGLLEAIEVGVNKVEYMRIIKGVLEKSSILGEQYFEDLVLVFHEEEWFAKFFEEVKERLLENQLKLAELLMNNRKEILEDREFSKWLHATGFYSKVLTVVGVDFDKLLSSEKLYDSDERVIGFKVPIIKGYEKISAELIKNPEKALQLLRGDKSFIGSFYKVLALKLAGYDDKASQLFCKMRNLVSRVEKGTAVKLIMYLEKVLQK